MAGAAAVNVQVKTGTNNFRGSAFEYATDARMRARNYFLPADRDKGTSSVNVFGGTDRRSDRQEQAVLLRERRDDAPAHVQRQCPGSDRHERVRLAAAGGSAPRRFFEHGDAYLRSADGQSDHRRRPRAVRLRELRAHVDGRPALRVVQFHSGESHQSDLGGDAREARAAHAGGVHEQLFRRQRVRHDLSQDRREGDL